MLDHIYIFCDTLFDFNLESDGNTSSREMQRLKKKNLQLEVENNLLKLKIEVLMDMVSLESYPNMNNPEEKIRKTHLNDLKSFFFQLTETTVECHLMEKEVEDIKTQNRRKK